MFSCKTSVQKFLAKYGQACMRYILCRIYKDLVRSLFACLPSKEILIPFFLLGPHLCIKGVFMQKYMGLGCLLYGCRVPIILDKV